MKDFNKALADYLYAGQLSEKDQVTYYLVERYKDKVSPKLLKKAEALIEQGKKSFHAAVKEQLSQPSWLDKVLKDTKPWNGGSVIRPFGDDEK